MFALVNLPETVKGALFARYSRYPGTLRRLYLEEFAADVPDGGRPFEGEEGERAAGLYERVFLGYGDDSIAQVGGAHIACEWVSNILTKVLQRGRLAAYLEQSTRYIPYDNPMPESAGGGVPLLPRRRARPRVRGGDGRAVRDLLALARDGQEWAAERWPRGDDEPERAWQSSIRAKALDLLRGLLPAATLSHVGIFASGQAYEQLLLRMMASPLPEARGVRGDDPRGAEAGDAELRRPGRAPRPRRRVDRLPGAAPRGDRALGLAPRPRPARAAPTRRRSSWSRSRAARRSCSASSLFESARHREREIRDRVRALPPDERADVIAELAGERANRRHRPGRGWEAVRYRFEIVSDYGGFRDLQRHRMLTCQWQRAVARTSGAGVPEEVREAGVGGEYERALEISRARVRAARGRRACPPPRPTPSASATGSATSST